MAAVVIVGAQWGDEGKGKIVDIYTEFADLVVRYGGGPNAGHTLVVGRDKVIVRLIPSGILRASTQCVLGQGMVIDPESLFLEVDELQRRGHLPPVLDTKRLAISDRAHAILPYHVLVDTLREQGEGALGTTKRGVGPSYEDKIGRRGVQLGALRDLGRTEKIVRAALVAWEPHIRALGGTPPKVEDVMTRLAPFAARIVPLLADGSALVEAALRAKKNILFEGAQGTLLDIDHGTYPFVTSSNATAGGACTGAGVGPTRLDAVIGLTKAYCTRVGSGPFPTELGGELGDRLRKAGDEFGSVTGRPRRTGWLDLPALKYAVRVNGLDGLALTKLDVLTGLREVPVCVAYERRGVKIHDLPHEDVAEWTPLYEILPGWQESLGHARSLGDLPATARAYVERVEHLAECPVTLVSVGSGRDETILLSNPFH